MTADELVGTLRAHALSGEVVSVTPDTLIQRLFDKPLKLALSDAVLAAVDAAKQGALSGAALKGRAIPQAVLWLNDSRSSEAGWF